MQKTAIEYLDYTWNPIAMRCAPCSPGCEHCWHLRTADRLCENPGLPVDERFALAGDGPFVLRERELDAPLRTRKPAVIGVQFMGDLFHEDVPDEFILKVCEVMWNIGRHTFLILTKRPKRMADFFRTNHGYFSYVDHIYFGLTVCNQQEADEKIPEFLKVPGKKWLSVEPMLGPVNLMELPRPFEFHQSPYGWPEWLRRHLHLVILGGESGPGARPMHPDWVRSVRDQCQAAGVPFYLKQNGEWAHDDEAAAYSKSKCIWVAKDGRFECADKNETEIWDDNDSCLMVRVGSKRAGRLLDGREWNELPWRANIVQ